MADPSKTEPATPKRRGEIRKRGQIARSQEINSFLVLLFAAMTLKFWAHTILFSLENASRHYLGHLELYRWTPNLLMNNLAHLVFEILYLLLPILLAAALGGVLAGMYQAGLHVSIQPITPNFSKLNPVNGIQRIFGVTGLAELLRASLKILLVGFVSYLTVKQRFGQFFLLGGMDLKQGLLLVTDVVYQLVFRILMVLGIIAILDFIYQKRQFERNIRMTKQEVREEMKQMEGDPQIRSRIRFKQRQMHMRRMMQAVPKAVVVVTNPVHLAVALEYDEKMSAPLVLAKGAGFVADKIKEIARENKIPIVEKPPLAQMLFKSVEIGKHIPPALYHAVAEIIAYVYQLKFPVLPGPGEAERK